MTIPLSDIDVMPQQLDMINEILLRRLPGHEVWAYGSRVSGYSWQYSDLDLVVVGETALDSVTLWETRDEFTESRLPYIVELKDWHSIPQHWRDEILRCYAVIHSPDRANASKE